MRIFGRLLAAATVLSVFAPASFNSTAFAADLINTFTDFGQGPRTDISGPPGGGPAVQSLGVSFTYTGLQPAQVTTLGVYDGNAGALIDNHLVTLYSLTGTPLTSTTVPAGSGTPGSFAYASTSPFTLVPGTTYVLSAEFGSNGTPNTEFYPTNLGTNDVFWDAGTVTGTLSASNFISRYSTTFVGGFPDTIGPNAAYVGPSLQASQVPEPASLALFGLGAVSLFAVARRRRCNG